jgi:hypothetical protein
MNTTKQQGKVIMLKKIIIEDDSFKTSWLNFKNIFPILMIIMAIGFAVFINKGPVKSNQKVNI